MTIETRSAFARRLDVSPAAVTQWAQAGRLVLAEDGRVDVEASEVRLAATKGTKGGKRQAGVAGVVGDESGNSRAGPVQSGTATLVGARIEQAQVRAQLDRAELDERLGRLTDRAGVSRGIADAMGPLMQLQTTISSRIAPKVAAETDVRRISDLIDDEVARALQETVDTLRAMIGEGTRQ